MNIKKISIFAMVLALAVASLACSIFGDDGVSLGSNDNVYSSDFENDDMFSEFADEGGLVESHFVDGGLEMTIHDKDVYFWAYPNADIPQNVAVQVDAKLIDGDEETGAGVICNYDYNTDNGIYFEVTFDGFFVVLKKSDAGWEYLQEFTPSDVVNTDDFNTIKAVCNAGSYEFIVNGESVTSFTDQSVLGDETAIYGYTYYKPESVIMFDNFYAEGLE